MIFKELLSENLQLPYRRSRLTLLQNRTHTLSFASNFLYQMVMKYFLNLMIYSSLFVILNIPKSRNSSEMKKIFLKIFLKINGD